MSNPWATWFDAAVFCAEAQSVIGLRIIRLASGGAAAASEAHRMVFEKVVAAAQAQVSAGMAITAGRGIQDAKRAAVKPYKRAVRANRRRLTRRS